MKNVLITGASRGLGLALARLYAENGFYVIACARNVNSDQLKGLKARCKDEIDLIPMDISQTDSVEKAAETVKKNVTFLDIIINNAGIHATDSLEELENVDIDNCLEVYSINTLGALRVTKAFISLLEKGTLKELINISTEAGSISSSERVKEFDYCMSKAALNMETKLLHNYLAKRGIKVLAVHPGWVKTDMGGMNAQFSPDEAAKNVIAVIEKCGKRLDEPIFVDYTGKKLNF